MILDGIDCGRGSLCGASGGRRPSMLDRRRRITAGEDGRGQADGERG
jgi:hypothetical protein